MTHEELNGLYELYLMGALEPQEALEIEQHVADQCPVCIPRLQEATGVVASLSGIAEQQPLPPRLRKRVLASVKPETESRNWLFGVLGLSAACVALLVFALWTTGSMNSYRRQVAELEAQRNQLRAAVEILSQSQTRTVKFGLAENKPHGRVFVNPESGLVFVGSQLPQLASNRTFQLWLIPTSGAPESAGVFKPNAAGTFVNVRTTPVNTSRIHAVAVSVEPQGGSPAPTTTPILIVPLA